MTITLRTSGALILASCIVMLLVVRTLSQITVLGSDTKTCAELWKKKIQHIPHTGATLFFQYDMKVQRFLRMSKNRRWIELSIMAAVQLQSHLFTGLRSSGVNFIIDNSGVKNAPLSTKMNKWYTVSVWINFFEEGKPFYVLAVNGVMLKQEPMKKIVNRTAADVNIYGGSLVPDETEAGSCEIRSISLYGPNRINLQKGEVEPNSKDGETIIVSTEFVSSGVDVYEVRAINPKKPLELLTSFKLSSHVRNEGKKSLVKHSTERGPDRILPAHNNPQFHF